MYSENQHLEFKQLWKDDHLKTICAFANGEGGRLLIGVDDNGAILGVDDAKSLLEILPNKINNKLALLVDVTENWGRGTLNIIDYCLQAGLPKPEFAYQWGAVRTTFYRRGWQDEGATVEGGGVSGGVSGGVKELLSFIENHPGLSARELSSQLNIPLRTIERWLKELREQGLIEFRGAPKTGGYVVLQGNE